MATVTPPSNIGYGTVKGRFIGDEIDGVDGDSNPDFYAPTGTLVFTASVRKNLDPAAAPDPATVVRRYIPGILDSQGYVCVPIPDPDNEGQVIAGARTIKLIATNDADLNPVDWNWRVDFNFRDQRGDQIDMPSFSFDLPEGGTVDLTTVSPVDSSTGDAIVVGPEGPAGPRGATWFTGHGSPAVWEAANPGFFDDALPDDEYLDLDTGDIYTLS